jgi:hypothetical protein
MADETSFEVFYDDYGGVDGVGVLADNASGEDVYKASRVSEAFDREKLKLFTGCRTWAK